MAKIISVNVEHPRYGETEVNVERVIAVIPEKRRVLFEDVYWDLDDKNFKKLYQAWKGEAVSIEPKQCLYSGGRYTNKDREVLCAGCEEDCKLRPEDSQRMVSAKAKEELLHEPKFHVGDVVRHIPNEVNMSQVEYKITKIDDKFYYSKLEDGSDVILFGFPVQDTWELVEQKPVESEESHNKSESNKSLHNGELTEFEKELAKVVSWGISTAVVSPEEDINQFAKDNAHRLIGAARKQFIEEACEWLCDNQYPTFGETIKEFRNALKKGGEV